MDLALLRLLDSIMECPTMMREEDHLLLAHRKIDAEEAVIEDSRSVQTVNACVLFRRQINHFILGTSIPGRLSL